MLPESDIYAVCSASERKADAGKISEKGRNADEGADPVESKIFTAFVGRVSASV